MYILYVIGILAIALWIIYKAYTSQFISRLAWKLENPQKDFKENADSIRKDEEDLKRRMDKREKTLNSELGSIGEVRDDIDPPEPTTEEST